MTGPLDATAAAACVEADPRLTYANDMLFCSLAGPPSSAGAHNVCSYVLQAGARLHS